MTKNIEMQQPLREEISLLKVLHALSDPVRMEIVLKIAKSGEVACGAFDIPMPKSTLSHHFKVLRESGVVASKREGNELINSLRLEDLEARFPGVIDAIIAAGSDKTRVLQAIPAESDHSTVAKRMKTGIGR